jgi:oxygen-independent coproporphyrinogen III oxidase
LDKILSKYALKKAKQLLLYLHIPFCDSKCSYCAFNSYTHLHKLRADYMQAIVTQLAHDLKRFTIQKKSIRTLFIGGGTPSTVDAKLYGDFFKLLRPYLMDDIEMTTEANPNSATKEWLAGMKKHGINRVSFGTQTFNEEKLKMLNRSHTADDTKRAVSDAYDLGILNLSIDLIYATNMDSKELLEHDLNEAFALPINHLSAYALTIEAGTELFNRPETARENEDDTQWFLERINKQGFTQYEISNFGTYQSTHNRGYWEYDNYLGIGSGAVGCVDGVRYYPQSDVQGYIDDPLQISEETLSAEDVKSEKILLAMRSCVGFEKDLLNQQEQEKLAILLAEKKLIMKDSRIYNEDYLLADELALFLLGD